MRLTRFQALIFTSAFGSAQGNRLSPAHSLHIARCAVANATTDFAQMPDLKAGLTAWIEAASAALEDAPKPRQLGLDFGLPSLQGTESLQDVERRQRRTAEERGEILPHDDEQGKGPNA